MLAFYISKVILLQVVMGSMTSHYPFNVMGLAYEFEIIYLASEWITQTDFKVYVRKKNKRGEFVGLG